MTFTASTTVEPMILDVVSELGDKPASMVREDMLSYEK
jgi:hypothetical protein